MSYCQVSAKDGKGSSQIYCLKMSCTTLNPMVLLIIIPMKNGYFIGNIPYFQTNPYSNMGLSENRIPFSHRVPSQNAIVGYRW